MPDLKEANTDAEPNRINQKENPTRREFLGLLGGAGLAVAFPSLAFSESKKYPKEDIQYFVDFVNKKGLTDSEARLFVDYIVDNDLPLRETVDYFKDSSRSMLMTWIKHHAPFTREEILYPIPGISN